MQEISKLVNGANSSVNPKIIQFRTYFDIFCFKNTINSKK